MNRQQLAQFMAAGASGTNPYTERDTQMQLQKYLKGSMIPEQTQTLPGKDVELPGPTQDQRPLMGHTPDQQVTTPAHYQPGVEAGAQQLQDKTKQDAFNSMVKQFFPNGLPDGSGVTSPLGGSVTKGYNFAAIAPHEAKAFQGIADKSFKPINDILDSSKSTLDNLNMGNTAGDKLAMINEARLAASTGGSRALGTIIPLLTGGKTGAGDFQGFMNYLQNTPNIPTLQPAQRDALRESVFNRLDQTEQMANQSAASLAQQGAQIAPHTDYNSLIGSYATPASQKLQGLRQMQQQYKAQRQKMQPQPPVSQPSTSDANPSTLDKLMSFFKSPSSQAPQAAPQTNDPAYQRYQELLKKSQTGN